MKALLFFCIAACMPAVFADQEPEKHPKTIYDVHVRPMARDTASTASLRPYKDKVLLIVNVASKCGFTRQYSGLEAIHRKFKDRGFEVLGFPCNDFGAQEPGTEEEIVRFCKTNYEVGFKLYAKVHVKGDEQAPIYKFLLEHDDSEPAAVKWNFEKFLIGRDGKVVRRFRSAVEPGSKELVSAIEHELARDAKSTRPDK